MHKFNKSPILDSKEMMGEYVYQNLRKGRVLEEAQNLAYLSRFGYKLLDVPGSLMYTLANSANSETKISLIRPDFHTVAFNMAKEISFEEQRSALLLSRMVWYGELLFWMNQLKRYDCILCNPDVSRLEFPNLALASNKCRQLQRVNFEPKILA